MIQNNLQTPTVPVDMALHHVGVAVKSIDRALTYYTGLFGFRQATEPVEVPSQNVRVCFVEVGFGVLIELVEGLGDGSPVADIVQRTGAGPYHLCYQVADLDDAVRRLCAGGCFRLRRFQHSLGMTHAHPHRFAFLLTPDRQLFELCEARLTED